MGCCGQQRAALVHGNVAESRETGAVMPDGIGPDVLLEFMRRTNIAIRGPVTRRGYLFQEGAYIQAVDHRDAATLIATGYFRRV